MTDLYRPSDAQRVVDSLARLQSKWRDIPWHPDLAEAVERFALATSLIPTVQRMLLSLADQLAASGVQEAPEQIHVIAERLTAILANPAPTE